MINSESNQALNIVGKEDFVFDILKSKRIMQVLYDIGTGKEYATERVLNI